MQKSPPPRHPNDDELEQFLAARLAPADQQRVVRHLLAGCAVCSRKLVGQAPERLLQSASEEKRTSRSQSSLRERTLAEALKQDALWRTDDKKLIRSLELLRQSSDAYYRASFQQVTDLQGLSLAEALLQRVAKIRLQDPKALQCLAYKAVKAAKDLGREEYGLCRAVDLQTQAWAELANAYRINEEFDEAASAFNQARSLLQRGSGDLRLWAQVSDFEASFLRSQRRMAEVVDLTDVVCRIYNELGDTHLQGRALISKSNYLLHNGSTQKALRAAQEGLALIEVDREPQLLSIANQNLLNALIGVGKIKEAGAFFLKSGLRESSLEHPIALIKVRWMEAKLLARLDRASAAEKALMETRSRFLDLELDYTAAVVGLDLLSLWHCRGKSTQVREMAQEVYGVFRDLGIRQEAIKAQRYLN